MRVETFWLTLDFGHDNVFTIFNLSRVAVKRYRCWYMCECTSTFGPMPKV